MTQLERRLAIHYAKVRERCYGRPVKPPKPPALKPLVYRVVLREFNPPKRERWQKIVDEVCMQRGISFPDMMLRAKMRGRRGDKIAKGRWECWYRIRHELNYGLSTRPSMAQIAKWFGLADHSSVSYGLTQWSVILKREEHSK